MSQPSQGEKQPDNAKSVDHLERGRRHYEQRAWADAYEALVLADSTCRLGTDDLERLAMSAYLIGREQDYLKALDRAHRAFLDADECARAARCAFWIGLCLLFRGETGPATGWFGRAGRIIAREGGECAEEGYVLLSRAARCLAESDSQGAYDAAAKGVEVGERFREPDLIACTRHLQGQALLQQWQVEQGLALLDEAMVSVVAGELSPRMTGLIYCSVIDSCMQFYAFDRAREWTFALSRWCEGQSQLVSFTGACLVHRAEIMQLQGAWPDAVEEAHRACSGFPEEVGQQPPAAAFYRRGELHRLRGEFTAAEEAYRDASARGLEPQPGLALLRMAQGRLDAATIAIRRTVNGTSDRLQRTKLLPACVEIMLAAGDVAGARDAWRELEEIARDIGVAALGAMAAHARGSVELAEGNAAAALWSLRQAFEFWHKAGAPYQAARVRELVGLACHALGDEEAAGLELEVAKTTFQQLGGAPDLDRITSHSHGTEIAYSHGLTKRELQILRLLAAGRTNKVIASELFVSQRTVDRHVSNLFGKLDVSSRAAAASYAHKHRLI